MLRQTGVERRLFSPVMASRSESRTQREVTRTPVVCYKPGHHTVRLAVSSSEQCSVVSLGSDYGDDKNI